MTSLATGAREGVGLVGLVERLSELGDRHLLHYKRGKLVATSYPELQNDIRTISRAFTAAGIAAGMRVGLLGENSYAWIVHDLALLDLGVVTVTFPVEEMRNADVEDLQRDYELDALLVSPRERNRRECSAEWIGTLVVDEPDVPRPHVPEPVHDRALDPDVFTLAFSSGTSGRLKCVMLGRRGIEELVLAYHAAFPFRPDDAILIVLPLSAIQQRLMIYAAIWHGFDMHLVELPLLMRGLKEMRPTILAGPPAFYEVLENRFRALPRSRQLPLLAAGHALQLLPPALRARLARRVFAPFYDAYGARMRLMLTGSAPSRMSTLRLFRLLCLPLVQAYGLTETGFISWNLPWQNRIGSVGKLVFPGTVRLREDGEILVRYPNRQSYGYFGLDPAEEALTFLPDDWVATGDIGRFDADGYLYIVGRKKEILITRGGYKLQPEPIEQELADHPAVDRAVLVGGDDLPAITAVVALREDATEQDEAAVRARLKALNAELPSAGRVQRTLLTREPFTVDSGLLTRNLKVDRRAVAQRFAAELGAEPADA